MSNKQPATDEEGSLNRITKQLQNNEKAQENVALQDPDDRKQANSSEKANAEPDQAPPDPEAEERSHMAHLSELTSKFVAEGMPLQEASKLARSYLEQENQLTQMEQQYLADIQRQQETSSGRGSLLQALFARKRFNSEFSKEEIDAERKALNAAIHKQIGDLRARAWTEKSAHALQLQNDLAKNVATFNTNFTTSKDGKEYIKYINDIAPTEEKKRSLTQRIGDPNDRAPEVEKARDLLVQAMSDPNVAASYESMHAAKDKAMAATNEAVAFQEKTLAEFPDHFNQSQADNLIDASPIHKNPGKFEAVAETPEKIAAKDTVAEKMKELIDEFVRRITSMFGLGGGPKNSV